MPDDYGQDNIIRDSLLSEIDTYREFIALRDEIDAARNAMELEFHRQWKKKMDRQRDLESRLDELLTAFNSYVSDQTLKGRRRFMGRMVNTRLLKKPGEYDPNSLHLWARQFKGLLAIPKDKEKIKEITRVLQDEHPTLLGIDESAALKVALETYDDGTRVYDDAPVSIVWAATQTSKDHFLNILGTLAAEEDHDLRNA